MLKTHIVKGEENRDKGQVLDLFQQRQIVLELKSRACEPFQGFQGSGLSLNIQAYH